MNTRHVDAASTAGTQMSKERNTMPETQTEQQPELINQFVDYLRNERHFSPYTARCYGADLRQYVEYLESDHAPESAAATVANELDGPATNAPITIADKLKQADPMVVRGFLSHLDQFGYSPATTARKIATLRS
ncbi:MAG: site-specific integrase, partial [Planctomycetota bacterium]